MKILTIAAALAALLVAAPAQAAGLGQLPASFLDQGTQVPAFPGSR